MWPILLESVLFLSLLGVVGGIVFTVLRLYTPLGTRLAQSANRRRLEESVERHCPRHGPHAAHELVRLPSGETMCPRCYEETLHGVLD